MSEVEDPTPATTDAGEQDAPMTAAAARKAELALPPDIAADSISGYLRTSVARIKGGESGVLPVVGGLLLISILFQSLNSNFLTAGNLVNLLVQAAVFSLLAMAEVFVLLLGEIDLSVGFVAAVSAAIMATRIEPLAQLVVAAGRRPLRCWSAPASACCRARSSPASACPRSL